MRAWQDGEDYLVQGPGPELKEVGARWSEAHQAWKLPATTMNARTVEELGLGVSLPPVAWPSGVIDDDRLYDFQRHAAYRLAHSPRGLIVCLSPGLGKTAVAIAAADLAVPDDQVVVVTLASLLRTWEREIAKWARVPGDVYIVQGKIDHEKATAARWIIVSWDKVVREKDVWGRGWPLFILDESVLSKSRSSKRFKALQKIRRGVDRMWLLSASPTTRFADDLWAQLNLVWPRAFPSYWRFAERYTVTEENIWSGSRSVVGTRTGRDAARDNEDLIMVVNQEDVLDLPEYLFEPPLEVALAGRQLRAYDQMARDFVAELSDGSELVAKNEVARLMQLQRIASYWDGESAKHDAIVDRVRAYEAPHLIWTHWKDGAEALAGRLRSTQIDTSIVNGDTPTRERDGLLEAFKRGDIEALVLSLGVGKFGHTFTETKTIWYNDESWNADDYFQSLHRVRRIGLKHRPVVVPVRAPGTVDDLVADNLEGKLGGISRMTQSHLKTLLKGLGR